MPEKYLQEMRLFFEELGIEVKSYSKNYPLNDIPCFTATLTPSDKPIF